MKKMIMDIRIRNVVPVAALLLNMVLFMNIAPATAQGLAMHGTPKYPASASHLEYANPDAPKGGTLRQAGIGTFDTVNPFAIKGKAADGLNLVYDRLMARVWDEPFTLYPLIAERVEVPEDRSSFTVHINPRARFHDGSPVTADDVLFSYQTLKESGRPNMRRIYALATTVTKDGPLRVTFKFGEGFDRETVMIFAMMPVLSQAWWNGRPFDSTTLDIPLSNGPYKIASIDPGRRITYERVKDYWAADLLPNKGHFNFDIVTYDYFRDDMVAFEAFKAGALDMRRELDAGRWASSYDFPAVKTGTVRLDEIPHRRAERTRALIFNTRRPPFDDRMVRKALSQVLDFDWLNRNLFHGQYRQITSYFPNTELAAAATMTTAEKELLERFRADLPPEVFGPPFALPNGRDTAEVRANLKRADELLTQAGLVVKNGVRVDKNGKPFKFEIMLSAPEDEKVALSYIRSLKRLGIDAHIRVLDAAAFLGRLNNYDYDMVLYYWQNSLSPGTEQYLYWSCEAAGQPARWNFAGICNPAIDYMAGAIANAQSREDLVALSRGLDRALTWGYYAVPLYYAGKDYAAVRTAIKRPAQTPLYGIVTETWWHE